MFEEFVVGDLFALNLVDYLDTADFTDGGGGWWYGDMNIPKEYGNSEYWYMWFHLYTNTNATSGLRLGFVPSVTCRSIRISHAYSTTTYTWTGVESYEPPYISYASDTGTILYTGDVKFYKRGTTWMRMGMQCRTHKRNQSNEYHDIQTNDADFSGFTFNTDLKLRLSCAGLTGTTPIYGRVELYALSPRNII